MARPVYYSDDGDGYRLSPYSKSQERQHLSADRSDQLDDLGNEFKEALQRSLAEHGITARADVPLPGGGRLRFGVEEDPIRVDEDGLRWMIRNLAGYDFVLEQERK